MIEDYKDYCVLKAFDVSEKEFNDCQKLVVGDGVKLFTSQTYLDASLILVNESESEVVFNKILNSILSLLSDKVYADFDTTLQSQVVKKAKEKNIKIAVAESLTGGMVCSTIVDVPGSSAVLYEGFVTYTNSSKVRRLHVKSSTLETYGAVSSQICTEMVQGLLMNKEVQLAVSTTGCAGPDSDEFDTPIGRVYVGIGFNEKIKVKELNLDGNRETIRKTVTNMALYLMLNTIENNI